MGVERQSEQRSVGGVFSGARRGRASQLSFGIRLAAAVVAISAWAGLLIQMVDSTRIEGGVWPAAWSLLQYFTISTNVLVGVVFTALATERKWLRTDWIIAGTMQCIVLVAVIYATMLASLQHNVGLSAIANGFLHRYTPLLVVAYWLLFARKGNLHWRHVARWLSFPLLYLGYALLRGGVTGHYPYPFLDVADFGWAHVALSSTLTAMGFVVVSAGVVWLDNAVARTGSRADALVTHRV